MARCNSVTPVINACYLFRSHDEDDDMPTPLENDEVSHPPKKTCSGESDDLQDFLSQPGPQSQRPQSTTPLEMIKEAMTFFETNGERPKCLENVYQALLSIPPTSCEAER